MTTLFAIRVLGFAPDGSQVTACCFGPYAHRSHAEQLLFDFDLASGDWSSRCKTITYSIYEYVRTDDGSEIEIQIHDKKVQILGR